MVSSFGSTNASTARSIGLRFANSAGALSAYAAAKSFSRHEKIELTDHLVPWPVDLDALLPRLMHSLAASVSCLLEALPP